MKTMHPTYNLKPIGINGSRGFYARLSDFTDQWLQHEIPAKHQIIDAFLGSTIRFRSRFIRTPEEAYLEFLTLGTYLVNYSDTASHINSAISNLMVRLYGLRNRFPRYKALVDRLRGIISYFLLRRKFGRKLTIEADAIDILLNWLAATGEFNQELLLLNDWKMYLNSLCSSERITFIRSAEQTALTFSLEAKQALGEFTSNVQGFLKVQPKRYRFRENFFLTGRKENEYFLNMVGAEIINRVEHQKFLDTTDKLLLLPTCMRKLSAEKCKAVFDGKGMLCQGCNSTCNIHLAAGTIGYKGVKTYIIHHSSMFSENLKILAAEKDTGIIGVACVLNLMAGGYELKKQNIPAQCIYLDFSGCRKHWRINSFHQPTTIQLNRLMEMVG